MRVENVQVRKNENAGYANADLKDGSHGTDYLRFLKDSRADWQRVFESEVGTTHQNDYETVTKHYIVDYLSRANRDILVTEDGSYTQRYVYDENSRRISTEFDYADGTTRGTTNAKGEYGENLQSDFAAQDIRKVWYRTSHLGSTLITVDEAGAVIGHTIYDPWGAPLTETYPDANFAPLDNANNFTGYSWDEVLGLYFAQNRFYDAGSHRFTQEDPMRDDTNWYAYCGNDPLYKEYQRPKEQSLWDVAASGFGAGYKVGRDFAIWEWGYGAQYQCVDKKAGTTSSAGKQIHESVRTNRGNELDITPSVNHSVATKNPGTYGIPNSSVDILDSKGNIATRRWYDSKGRAYRDVDMTNHGNAKLHPEYPHEHFGNWSNGTPKRSK